MSAATIAEAVKTLLAGQTFAPVPLAGVTRSWLPRRDIADASSGAYCFVVPRNAELSAYNRANITRDTQIDVAIQAKVSGLGNTTIDPYADLVEQVSAFLRLRNLTSASWIRQEHSILIADEHAESYGFFTALISVFYRTLE